MILSRRCALDGVQLDEIDEAVVIQSIDPGTPAESMSAVDRMGGWGQRITAQHWQTLEVRVTYGINIPKRQLARRREVFDAVNAWALRKGWLTVNWMEGRRMWVEKVILPGSGDLWDWTAEFTITFRAYGVPFWQDELPAQAVSGTAASGRVWITPGGNTESVLDVSFRNMSGMIINNFWVQTGGRRITLGALRLGGNETLTISHRTDGLLQMRIGDVSVYDRYTGADDLIVKAGENAAVDFSADRAGILTVQSFGRWI